MSSRSPSERLDLTAPAPIPATWGLVALTGAVHLLTGLIAWERGQAGLFAALVLDRSPVLRASVGGQVASLVDAGQWWRLVSSVLLHGDLGHLGVNLVSLWVLGRLLEPLLGSVRWLGWFFLGGVGASIGSHLAGVEASDGGSGGAFALLGAAAVLGWRLRDQLDEDDAWMMGPVLWGFIALNLVLSVVLPWIDATGHAVGLGVGLLLGALARRPGQVAPRGTVALWGLWLGACAVALGFWVR
ncbi:MAG: rhomboid family intramembrane serine protease [Deltaproteobacteria bacterium]|nr:rhomboid family intramembrane serine protease [Deltaproteobacteria bacterium]